MGHSGTKKWITNGTFAYYFTVGCKTKGGYAVILVPRVRGFLPRRSRRRTQLRRARRSDVDEDRVPG